MEESIRMGDEEEEEVDDAQLHACPPWFVISGPGTEDDNDDSPLDPPIQQLERFLDQWWSDDPSLDRSKTEMLVLSDVVITRPLLSRLLSLIEQPHDADHGSLNVTNDHINHSPATTSINDTPDMKFLPVGIQTTCRFFSESDVTTPEQDGDVCALEDKISMISALTRSPSTLSIEDDCIRVPWCIYDEDNSPEILLDLLSVAEIDNLQTERLSVCLKTPLSDLQYARLSSMIQGSDKLTDLYIQLPYANVPRAFYDSLANSLHIEKLSLRHYGSLHVSDDLTESILSNLITGDDGNGVVARLLRNPRSQLRVLDLSFTNLQDRHLIALAQILPSSKLKDLNFFNARIQAAGLLEFARQLPKMHTLKSVSLAGNPWEYSSTDDESKTECGSALLQALIESPNIFEMDCIHTFGDPRTTGMDSMHSGVKDSLFWHYLSLNRAGRKILTSPPEHPIPDGLWPHILARAGRSMEDGGPCPVYIHEDTVTCVMNGPANAVYFFLQHSPKIFSYF